LIGIYGSSAKLLLALLRLPFEASALLLLKEGLSDEGRVGEFLMGSVAVSSDFNFSKFLLDESIFFVYRLLRSLLSPPFLSVGSYLSNRLLLHLRSLPSSSLSPDISRNSLRSEFPPSLFGDFRRKRFRDSRQLVASHLRIRSWNCCCRMGRFRSLLGCQRDQQSKRISISFKHWLLALECEWISRKRTFLIA